MKLLVNTSNLYVGGSLQIALSFLNEIKKYYNNEYHIILSSAVKNQIDFKSYPENFKFYLIEKSPASLKTRLQIVKKLNNIENMVKPDIVFTIAGPSYWKPKSLHLLGFNDGWVYNPDSIAYSKLSFLKKIKMKLHVSYKKYYLLRDSKHYVIETNDAKKKLSKCLNVSDSNIYVVGNTYSDVFNDKSLLNKSNKYYIPLPKKIDKFRFLYIAHNHPSKNLSIIRDILNFNHDLNIEFVLTIDDKTYDKLFSTFKNKVINLGPIAQKSCPSVYSQCDAVFAPTLLETFSAVYPEAMKMKVPILTSNFSFATSICKDAALYFDPLNIDDIIKKINLIKNDIIFQKELIKKGESLLSIFESAETRTIKYLELCRLLINDGASNVDD